MISSAFDEKYQKENLSVDVIFISSRKSCSIRFLRLEKNLFFAPGDMYLDLLQKYNFLTEVPPLPAIYRSAY